MIDIHSHILWNLDDGSKSIEESIKIVQEAEKAGITDIICTPHHGKRGVKGATPEQIKNSVIKLQEELRKVDCLVNLYPGNEIYVEEDLMEEIQKKTVMSLAEEKYILIELPMQNEYHYIEDMIFDIKKLGKIPILAHPERYSYIQENPNKVLSFLEIGVLLQCNLGSVLGKYGNKAKKTVKELLKSHAVSIMASDIHRADTLYLEIESAIQKLDSIIGKEEREKLVQVNPKKIIEGLQIPVPIIKKIKKVWL